MENTHVAVVGTGRVGRTVLLLLTQEWWVDKLTLVDTKENLASAIEEEVRHALASTKNEIKVDSFSKDEKVQNADIILICAGTPRDSTMGSRTDLTEANAEIIRNIAEVTPPGNQGAKFFIVTNPVDAMATLFKKISGRDWVISTGTNLETQRFRAEISRQLEEPLSSVSGFVAGEHGEQATFLWSSVKVDGVKLNDYLASSKNSLDKSSVENYVKTVSKSIIDSTGGTRHGPATSFRDILRSVALNENKIFPVGTPYKIKGIDEPVMISRPQVVGSEIGPEEGKYMNNNEISKIKEAAKKVYSTYSKAKQSLV